MKLIRVVSGGQTGADTAGLLAARAVGLLTGGFAPKGWITEIGPRPALSRFGLVQHTSDKYPPRTAANIKHSHATLIIATNLDGGSALTAKLCDSMFKPMLHIEADDLQSANTTSKVVSWIFGLSGKHDLVLNVAGNRESRTPGIQRDATAFLKRVFRDSPH
jgi:Circularly permutated YpsA SLOG family